MLLDATALDAAASVHTSIGDVTTSLAFADQAGNLAGALFPLSLPSYLLFLYFLGYEGNRCPKTAQFGSQFLLLFVISTVVTGIVTKGTYSSSLADVDWLHGGAETLLTTSNLFLGFGLAGALNAGKLEPMGEESFPKVQAIAAGVLAASLRTAHAGSGFGERHVLRWTDAGASSNLPHARGGAAVARFRVDDDVLLLFGGCSEVACFDALIRHDVGTSAWYEQPVTGKPPNRRRGAK